MERRKLVIVGSGPAAYTAAIYAARANLEPLLFEGFFSGPAGGQLMTTTEVENYPGFPEGISGPLLMEKMRMQAERFGTVLLTEDVESVDLRSIPLSSREVTVQLEADTLIIATGSLGEPPGRSRHPRRGVLAKRSHRLRGLRWRDPDIPQPAVVRVRRRRYSRRRGDLPDQIWQQGLFGPPQR